MVRKQLVDSENMTDRSDMNRVSSAKKNIILVGSAYPLRGGGISTFNELLATKLQDAGHQVKIVTFSLQYPNFLFPGKTQYALEPRAEHLNIEVSLNSINPFSWIKVGRKIKRESPDVV
ncbi:MAG: D-inositol-3-phosphate glycosyltransferase, partial [Bacteroidia bacterium]